MELRTSLLIKSLNDKFSANLCVGERTVFSSGVSDGLHTAVKKALAYPYAAPAVKNVLVSVDFTEKFKHRNSSGSIIYIKILPVTRSHSEHYAPHSQNDAVIKDIVDYTVLFDYEKGFVNTNELFNIIEKTKAKNIALNSPFSIAEANIEELLCTLISSKYPEVNIHSSRYLMNRSFIAREKLLLHNMILKPQIGEFIDNLKNILYSYDVSCPIYFLCSNEGFIGQSCVLDRGMDTYRCAAVSYIYDVISAYPKEQMYIADWKNESLYFVHNRRPHITNMPAEYKKTNIRRNMPVGYTLSGINSCDEFLDVLDSNNQLPGPVALVNIGNAPFRLTQLFEYPTVFFNDELVLKHSGICRLPYIIEMEAYKSEARSLNEVENELRMSLLNSAAKDGIDSSNASFSYERLPIKYLNDDQFILHGTLCAPPGGYYETND